jgi:4-amino-4-deoxy-L-arabinose transferase-like glycosyltransferase
VISSDPAVIRRLGQRRDWVLVFLFSLARTAFCAYRAATQSIVSDEAFTWDNFLTGPWSQILTRYDANNHILYSILAKISISTFGVSEFALRLPTVLAGFFLILGTYAVLERTVRSRAIRWIALIALALDPLLLDFSVAARGYGLSLALLVWAIYFYLETLDILSGALLGLAISANLTILFPAVGLLLCPFLLRKGDMESRIQSGLRLAFTALALFGAICYSPLSYARMSNFYVGVPDFAAALSTLIGSSIRGSLRPGLFGTWEAAREIRLLILPALMLFVLAVSVRTFIREPERRPMLAPAVVLFTAVAGLVAARHFVGLNYPTDRLGLYLVLLFGLGWAIAAGQMRHRAGRGVMGALAGLLILQLTTQIQTRSFEVWPYDSASREIARRIREDVRGRPPDSVRLSVSWWLQPALDFYRRHDGIAALQSIKRNETTALDGFDYYVLDLRGDRTFPSVKVDRLRPLFSDPVSGVVLAKEPARE